MSASSSSCQRTLLVALLNCCGWAGRSLQSATPLHARFPFLYTQEVIRDKISWTHQSLSSLAGPWQLMIGGEGGFDCWRPLQSYSELLHFICNWDPYFDANSSSLQSDSLIDSWIQPNDCIICPQTFGMSDRAKAATNTSVRWIKWSEDCLRCCRKFFHQHHIFQFVSSFDAVQSSIQYSN